MRTTLVAVLLLIAVLLIYDSIFGGPGGAKDLLDERSGRVKVDAERIDP